MGMVMDITLEEATKASTLLEFAASNELKSFKSALESWGNHSIDKLGLWYTRRIGSTTTMSYEQRTPLMIAAQYGSTDVLNFILQSNNSVDVNRVAGSDRVTALHCAVSGGSHSTPAIIHRLIAASANIDALDANGNRAADLIPMLPRIPTKSNKQIDNMLKSGYSDSESSSNSSLCYDSESESKKEYAMSELPDINNGVYGSDEFRMYSFKIKPCSRAYTHDWTECPFAHPGENARRRDPKKCPYTCVPCPEFKKGSCKKGEDCEFAHGVFESWLHPAQYRTRLCKDEVGCARKVCFFAHKRDELRPVYASTGSAIPEGGAAAASGGTGGFGGVSTPPMSPSFAPLSPKNSFNVTAAPPSLQLPGSRLRSSRSARDVEFERELFKIESQFINQQQHFYQHQQQQQQHQQQQQVLSPRPSPRWSNSNNNHSNNMMPCANLETAFATMNVGRKMSPPQALLNSRAAAFVKRSQSFVDKTGSPSPPPQPPVSQWGSPNGKLDWGIHGEELNKLRKSNSFGFRGANNVVNVARNSSSPPGFSEPDVSWVNSLVKDEASVTLKSPNYGRNGAGNGDMFSPWEQLYIDQEQLVAN